MFNELKQSIVNQLIQLQKNYARHALFGEKIPHVSEVEAKKLQDSSPDETASDVRQTIRNIICYEFSAKATQDGMNHLAELIEWYEAVLDVVKGKGPSEELVTFLEGAISDPFFMKADVARTPAYYLRALDDDSHSMTEEVFTNPYSNLDAA